MAFEEVDIIEATASSAKTGISAGLAKIRSAKAKLRLTIRAEHFDAMGFKLDDRFVLLLGRGDDHGMIRLQKNKAGKIKPASRTFTGGVEAIAINLHHRPEFVDRSEKAVPVQWEIIDFATFEVVLPAWAEETAPEKTKRIAAVPAAIAAGQRDRERVEREAQDAARIREQRDQVDLRLEMARIVADALGGGQPEFSIDLTPGQKSILHVLVKKREKTVSKEALMTLVYSADGDDAPDEKILDVQICKIRPKLPAGVKIETVWGQGYRVVGDVNLLFLEGASA